MFIEISGDNTDTLDMPIHYKLYQKYVLTKIIEIGNFNFPQSMINAISFNTGDFLCKLPNDKYLCLKI